MAIIVNLNVQRALDVNGFAVPGALATFYNSGTTALRTVYSDPECTVPHPNPLAANGAGVFPPIYDNDSTDIRVMLTDAGGAALAGYPIDPVMRVSTEETGAGSVGFSPTVEIPETNVQSAIERVQQNIVEPLADFGLGVSGNGPLIENINSTATASGFYRYDGTTTGSFPSGVTASAGGLVLVFRRSSSSAVMLLIASGTNRIHYRRLATSWQAWRRLIDDGDISSEANWLAGSSSTPFLISPDVLRAVVRADDREWQDVTGSRNIDTAYRNTTGRTIAVSIVGDAITTNRRFQVSANGSSGWIVAGVFGEASSMLASVYAEIPPGWYYRVLGNVNINEWSELR